MDKIKETLRDSKIARWSALAIVSVTMFAGYFLTDAMSPLKSMLESELSWSSSDFGFYVGSYGFFNVFFGMLIIGGILLDKMGVRFTGLTSTIIMLIGVSTKFWAISTNFEEGYTVLGFKAQIFFASLGFAIFGVGVEIAGITVNRIVVKWFKGYEIGLAMGMQMAVARLGTLLAMAAPVPLAIYFGSISAPIAFSLALLVIGFLTFFVYMSMDRKLDASIKESSSEEATPFKFSDILQIFTNKGFWLISILCVLFYSSIFPFIKYASDLMVNKYGISEEYSGLIPSLLPLGTLFLTPFFGNLYDKKGKGATIMIIGSTLLIFIHGLFSIPALDHWIIASFLVILLGITLSLVPSAMWPSMPKIIPEKQLGTAYSLIFWIQNWGLMGVPALIGWVLNEYCISGETVVDGLTKNTYDYTYPMLIFTSFGVLALIISTMLKIVDKKENYGLQEPNIKN